MKIATLDERQISVARVYCRAILELAESADVAESLMDELQDVLDLRQLHPGFREFLTSPLVDPRQRRDLLEKIFRGKASDLLVNTLQVLNRHGRLDILETLVEVYRRQHQKRHQQIDVRVTTPVPLSDELRRELAAAASRMVGREPNLVEEVDESLIGGLVVRIGDRKYDTSVATQLRGLRQTLRDTASRAIYTARGDAM